MTPISENGDLHVVFGASGGAGGAIVRELAKRGKRVRAVTRSGGGDLPPGVEAVRADAADRVEARQACEGATVVYHAVNVPYPAWAETLPPVMDRADRCRRGGWCDAGLCRQPVCLWPGRPADDRGAAAGGHDAQGTSSVHNSRKPFLLLIVPGRCAR